MKKQHIYLDTSVFGGFFDDEFQEFTKKLLGKQATLIAFILPLKQYIMRIY